MFCRVSIVILSFLIVAASQAATRYYRYVDDAGSKVIRDTIPPELVHKGYDILGADGRLIKTVPRALTKEEIQAQQNTKNNKAVSALESQKQQVADKKLLSIFSAPEDAERARDRKLEALDVLISVNRGNIARLQSEFDQEQRKAASLERAGQAVPDHLIEVMERIERQIEKLEDVNTEKNQEKEAVRKEYAKDIERLKMLMERQGQ